MNGNAFYNSLSLSRVFLFITIKWQPFVFTRACVAFLSASVCLLLFFFSIVHIQWHFQFESRSITANDSFISCQFTKIGTVEMEQRDEEQRSRQGKNENRFIQSYRFFLSSHLC